MLREAALIALPIAGLCGPAQAGGLSTADVQRLHDYERFVIPASREIPTLREMGARIDTLIAVAESSGGALDDAPCSDFRSALRDLPRIGGQTLEKMVSSLQAIGDPGVFAPPEWVALFTEIKAELEERLVYDAEVIKAYQRSVAVGALGLGQSFIGWEARPDAASHWTRFQRTLDRAPCPARGGRIETTSRGGTTP
jgi:hypothetical protein